MITGTGEDFKDGSYIIYVNGAYRDNTPLGKLMHDFACTNPESMYYNQVAETVRYFKATEEGKDYMCEILDEMLDKERKEGKREGKKELVFNLLQTGKLSIAELAKLAGFSVKEVKELQKELHPNS